MSEKKLTDGPKSVERRRFMEITAKAGFTAAVVAMGAGVLGSKEASAQVVNEEKERQKTAKYTMNVATAYRLGASRTYPIMQLDFKENIQNATNGQVYVKLAPGGQLGAGSALVQKVQAGTIQAAQHSIANFAPFAPAADVINIPYWCGENQKFINLVTSDAWKQELDPKIEAKGFKALWYVCIDPRTVAVRQGIDGPIRTPDQLRGIKFRVPGSKILQQFYQLIGANPTPVAWGETSSAIKQGVADALDPSVEALLVFGFKEILSSVTFNAAVPDSQVFSCNLKWLRSLPIDVQEGIEFASEITSRQNLAKVPAARNYAMAEMAKAGVDFYVPTEDEIEQWVAKAGAQLPAWDAIKKELVGSLANFDKLQEAANSYNNFYVHDI
ncbi:TRAP transporter substrate-binding protein [Desulfosediminicola ganghwensis]|uniref:TRAP transporter substrate-binding protein n=1 Tax=Desulfosediminicola ganghwensis TaxID=2569540 RepID=UPI0010AC6BC7|nr:TRAP transporter substrate-binding protein [Desulfosediminicola ganghwensis]